MSNSGHSVTISDDVEAQLAALPAIDLLVVNIGNPVHLGLPAGPIADARNGLLDYMSAGKPILAVHSAASGFPEILEWEVILGGARRADAVRREPVGWTEITSYPERHPIVHELPSFALWGESYSQLRVSAPVTVLADHEEGGERHPLAWATTFDDSRIVYNALGHTAEAYDAREHREVIRRSVAWLLREID
jgi:type 1 glutamine amidotransferase